MSSLSAHPLFEIDTKGACLLCFNPETENFTGHGNESTEKYFKMFLRYLQVDLTKFNSSFQPSLEGSGNANLSLSLCEKCCSVTHEFFEYFQDFERIRMQLDNCVRKVQEFIENGGRDEDLVREYRERVNPKDPKDKVNANVAENLRKETLEKCHIKLGLSIPKVLLKATNSSKRRCQSQNDDMTIPTPIKIEQADTGPVDEIDSSAEDHWKNEDDDNSSSADSEPTRKRHRTHKMTNKGIATAWKCVHCQTYYSGGPQLRTHLIKYHPKVFFADRIPDEVSEEDLERTLDQLIGKMKVTHYYGKFREPSFLCCWCVKRRSCTKRTMKTHLLRLHLQKVLEETGKVAHVSKEECKCDICGISVRSWRGLSWHKAMIHGKKRFKCNICRELFRRKEDLRFHHCHVPEPPLETGVKIGEEDEGEMDVSKTASTYQNLDEDDESFPIPMPLSKVSKMEEGQHLWSKSPESSTKKAVRSNTKKQTVKTPWQCKYCDKYYSTPSNLRTHLILFHTMAFFASRIPNGIEEQALTNAAKGLLGKMKISHYLLSKAYLQCTFCKSQCEKRRMYEHILLRHFKQAILAAGGTFPKIETEEDSKLKGHRNKSKRKFTTTTKKKGATSWKAHEDNPHVESYNTNTTPVDMEQGTNLQQLELIPDEIELVLEDNFGSDHHEDLGPDPLTI